MNLICGINPVLEALQAGNRHFDRLLITKGLRSRRLSEAIQRATRLGVPLRFEMRETLDRMAGGVAHQGIIAVVSEKPVLSLDELVATAREPALFVVLDGVEDPRNLGAILRSVEAAGADGVLLPERHSAGLSETVARASAGAIEHVRVARVHNLVQALEALKQRGVWIVGFDASGTERWDAVDMTRPVALVLGGEGRGIRRLVREHCDHLASIPHFGHISSLNVSVAAGVALYEAVRQRRAVPSIVRPIPARAGVAPRVVGPAPDDAETDPGARPGGLGGDEPAEEGSEEAALSVHHVDLSEDVAWAHQGPVVLKSAWFERARRPDERRRKGRRHGRPRGDDRGERREPREHRGEQGERRADQSGERRRDADSQAQPGPNGGPERSDGGGERRGKRRRRRRGGRDGAPRHPHDGGSDPRRSGGEPRGAAEHRGGADDAGAPRAHGGDDGGAAPREGGPPHASDRAQGAGAGAPGEGGQRRRRRRRRRH
jgi:23S rRNA (guanosine2251-2'-O)-methyltransferase